MCGHTEAIPSALRLAKFMPIAESPSGEDLAHSDRVSAGKAKVSVQ
jgi:hypothetical protein